jgi:hypothetical protein
MSLVDEQSFPKQIFIGFTLFLFMVTFERTVALIFVLNFGAGALNASILLFLATMTGIFYTFGFNRVWPHSRKQLSSAISLGFILVFASAINVPIIALFAVVIFQISIAPVLVHYLQVLQKGFTTSAVLGVSLLISTRALLDTASYYATIFGLVLLFATNLCWFGIWITLSLKREHELLVVDLPLTSTSALFSFLIIQLIFLGSPSVLSTWYFRNYLFTSIACLFGLQLGWYLLSNETIHQKLELKLVSWALVLLYTIAMGITIWSTNQILSIIFIFLAQICAVYLLFNGIRVGAKARILDLGRSKAGIQFIIILGTFFVIGAPFWTAMPLKFLLKYNDRALMYFLSILLPLSTIRSLLQGGTK